jgi:hypothetical protein
MYIRLLMDKRTTLYGVLRKADEVVLTSMNEMELLQQIQNVFTMIVIMLNLKT